jgi:hypothetical protein
MQPEAIPFDLTPRAFALSIFGLIAMVYTIRFIGRHIQPCWPLLQNSIALWLKRMKVDEGIDEYSENGFRGTFPPRTEIDLDRIIDEERNEPRVNDTRSCGTRAMRGPPVTGPQSQPG